jgi:DNA ligase-1
MPDLAVGETSEMKGSGSKPYVIKNCGPGGYSCTCPAWRNQSIDPRLRTCKHLRKLRGDAEEQARIGSTEELPSRKPEGADEKEELPILKAERWDPDVHTNVAGWWMSEKLDGVRAYWDGKQFRSRFGNLFLAPDWFVEGLPPLPLDGELWIGRKAFQRASGIARTHDRGEGWRDMRYVVFDAPEHGGEFEARLAFLEDIVGERRPPFAQVLEHQQCRGVDHLMAEIDRITALSGEGLMLRQPGSKYERTRSSTLLKVKPVLDAEAVVVGHEPGKGRHRGRMGALLCQTFDGKQFAIGTGFSDAQREAPPPVGAVVAFRYQELTDAGVPRHSRYAGLRPDVPGPTPVTPGRVPAPPRKKAATVTAPALPDLVRRFHFGEPVRFWEVALSGNVVKLSFGTTGGTTQHKEQAHPTAEAARATVEELIADKLDDGFVEVDRLTLQPLAPVAPAVDRPAGVRHFEFVGGTSSKFWEVWVEGANMYTKYGRIGSAGQTTIKSYPDEAGARKAAEKMVAEKTGKGYVEK